LIDSIPSQFPTQDPVFAHGGERERDKLESWFIRLCLRVCGFFWFWLFNTQWISCKSATW
jgi:hypothetical protein